MHHALDHDLIAEEQYSTPGWKSIDHVLNRRLLFDITRYQKTSLAMTSCDLKSCYDCITHTPTTLAMCRVSMFSTIQKAQHYTRTAFGDSEKTYSRLELPFRFGPQGVGQGNGAGPPVWTVVSLAMFAVLKKRGLATKMVTPITKQKMEVCGFAFVDDSDVISSYKRCNIFLQKGERPRKNSLSNAKNYRLLGRGCKVYRRGTQAVQKLVVPNPL